MYMVCIGVLCKNFMLFITFVTFVNNLGYMRKYTIFKSYTKLYRTTYRNNIKASVSEAV